MGAEALTATPADPRERIAGLEAELAVTNSEVLSLVLDMDERVEERTAELGAAQEELQRTNSELLQLTLELENRVAARTAELAAANAALRDEVTRRREAEEEVRSLNADLERRVEERTAELAAVNKELESFAYSVSHDLRAPLRGIDGWSQALLEDCGHLLDDQGNGYLATVRSEVRRMSQLIDALLRLSRVTRTEIRLEQVDLSELARAVECELRVAHPDRSVEVAIALGLTAVGDVVLLRALARNLLGNAWKFTGQCQQARIEFGATLDAGTTTYFVRDNGVGFDMAHASRLFAPFQRLHRAEEFPGTGIGLATVQRSVARHGGRIWAEGVPEAGATFYFVLGGGNGG